MASPDGNKALLSPPAEPSSRRSRPVADVWQGRRSGARRPCSIPVADSAPRRSPAAITAGPLPQGCHEARHRDASPAATHARLFPGDRRRPAAVVPGTAAKALSGGSARKLRQSAFFLARPPICRLMRPNTPAHCKSEPPAKRVVCSGPVRACYRLRLKTLAFTLYRACLETHLKSFHNSRKSHKNRVIEFHEQIPKINR